MQTLPKDPDAEEREMKAFSNSVFLFVPQILLLVVFMCMSLSFASFVCLTGPGELWRNVFNTVMSDVVKCVVKRSEMS